MLERPKWQELGGCWPTSSEELRPSIQQPAKNWVQPNWSSESRSFRRQSLGSRPAQHSRAAAFSCCMINTTQELIEWLGLFTEMRNGSPPSSQNKVFPQERWQRGKETKAGLARRSPPFITLRCQTEWVCDRPHYFLMQL